MSGSRRGQVRVRALGLQVLRQLQAPLALRAREDRGAVRRVALVGRAAVREAAVQVLRRDDVAARASNLRQPTTAPAFRQRAPGRLLSAYRSSVLFCGRLGQLARGKGGGAPPPMPRFREWNRCQASWAGHRALG